MSASESRDDPALATHSHQLLLHGEAFPLWSTSEDLRCRLATIALQVATGLIRWTPSPCHSAVVQLAMDVLLPPSLLTGTQRDDDEGISIRSGVPPFHSEELVILAAPDEPRSRRHAKFSVSDTSKDEL